MLGGPAGERSGVVAEEHGLGMQQTLELERQVGHVPQGL